MGDFDNFANEANVDTSSATEDFIDIDTSDAIEPQAVEPGEYKIRITGVMKDNEGNAIRTNSSGGKYFLVTFDIPDEMASKGLTNYFGLPDDTMDAKRVNGIKWNLETFKRCFNLDEINFSSMIGKEGWAILTLTEDDQYGPQNNIKKFITPA